MNKKANTGALIAVGVGFALLFAIGFYDFGLEGITGSLVLGDGTSSNCSTYVNESSTLVDDIVGCTDVGLYINASNIVLDCNGHTIQGGGGTTGFQSATGAQNNITIKNCRIDFFSNEGMRLGNMVNLTLINNTVQGASTGFSHSNVIGLKLFNNSVSSSVTGFVMSYCHNSTFYNNSVFDHTNSGFWIANSNNLVFDSNYAQSYFGSFGVQINSGKNATVINNKVVSLNVGISIEAINNSLVLNNSVESSSVSGLIDNQTYNVSYINNTINNSGDGINIANANASFYLGNVVYNNLKDIHVSYSSVNGSFNLVNNSFLPLSGVFDNYTVLSINDSVFDGEEYYINWSEVPSLPSGYSSFRNKFVSIVNISGSPSINKVTWSWNESEASGYNESKFNLFVFNSSGNFSLNNSPDTTNNVLSVSNLVPASTYGILENQSTNSGCGAYVNESSTLAGNITGCTGDGLIINASNIVLDCQGYSISGTGNGAGIEVFNKSNVIIANCTLINFAKGIFANSSIVNLTNNTARGNSYGLFMESSNSTLLSTTLYANSRDLFISNLFGNLPTVFMTNTSFLNPSGTIDNYTVLDITDYVENGTQYWINWSANPYGLFDDRISVNNKYVQITFDAVGPWDYIDDVIWWMNSSELLGYNASRLELWQYNGSDWLVMVNIPGHIGTRYYLETPVDPFYGNPGLYAVLQDNKTLSCGSYIDGDKVLYDDFYCGGGTAFFINSSNLTFDCNGHVIQGKIALNITGVSNVTVKNCFAQGSSAGSTGFLVINSPNLTLLLNGAYLSFANSTGFIIQDSSGVNLTLNNITISTPPINITNFLIINSSGILDSIVSACSDGYALHPLSSGFKLLSSNLNLSQISASFCDYGLYAENSSLNVFHSYFDRSNYSVYINGSNLSSVADSYLGDNTYSFFVENPGSSNLIVSLVNASFNLSSGLRFSLNDSVEAGLKYYVKKGNLAPSAVGWFPVIVNSDQVQITNSSGSVSINSIAFSWNESSLGWRNESNFALLRWLDNGVFSVLSHAPNISGNFISALNINPSGTYSYTVMSDQNCNYVNSDYTLSGNLNCDYNGLVVNASNLVIDCAGYKILGNAVSKIYSTAGIVGRQTNVTLKNCTVSNFSTGIYVDGANTNILNNNVSESITGVYIRSSYSNITGNLVYGSDMGFNFNDGGTGVIFSNNTVRDIFHPDYDNILGNCILMRTIQSSLFAGNNVTNCSGSGFFFRADVTNTTFVNNTVSKTGIGFYMRQNSNGNNVTGNTVFSTGRGFYLQGSGGYSMTNNLLSNNVAYSNTYGFEIIGIIDFTFNNTLFNNTAYSNTQGVLIDGSYNNNITRNLVYNNTNGFYLTHGTIDAGLGTYAVARNNTLFNNTAYNNSNGFLIAGAYNNTLTDNLVYNNTDGFNFTYGTVNQTSGVYSNAQNNILSNNNVFGNIYGVIFDVRANSSNNTLLNNSVYNNSRGFFLNNVSSVLMSSNSVFNNSLSGFYLLNSNSTLFGNTVFNNLRDVFVNSTSVSSSLNMTNTSFLNPLGTLENYTLLSLVDSVATGNSYYLNWSVNSSALPLNRLSFANKFVEIKNLSGGVLIDSVVWGWNESETGGYNENQFEIWKYNGTWSYLTSTRDTSANTLAVSNLNPQSTYGILEGGEVNHSNITYPNGGEFFTNYNESGLDTGEVINVTWTEAGAGYWYYLDYSSNGGVNWSNLNYTNNTYYLWNLSKSSGINESVNYTLRITSNDGVNNNTADVSDSSFWVGNCNVSPAVLSLTQYSWLDYDIIVCKNRIVKIDTANVTREIGMYNYSAWINVTMVNVTKLLQDGPGIVVKNSNISTYILGRNISASDSYIQYFFYVLLGGNYDGINDSKTQYRLFSDGYINVSNMSVLDDVSSTVKNNFYVYLAINGDKKVNITNSWSPAIGIQQANETKVFIENTSSIRFWFYSGNNEKLWFENLRNGLNNGTVAYSDNGFNFTVNNYTVSLAVNLQLFNLDNISVNMNLTSNLNNINVTQVITGSDSNNTFYNATFTSCKFGSSYNFFNNSVDPCSGYLSENAILNFSNTTWAMPNIVLSNANVTIFGNLTVLSKGRAMNWSVPANVTRFFPVYVKNSSNESHANANVSVYNSTGSLVWNGTTDANGWAEPNVTFTNFTYNNTYSIVVRGSVGSGSLSFFSDTPIVIQTGDEVNLTSVFDGQFFMNYNESGLGTGEIINITWLNVSADKYYVLASNNSGVNWSLINYTNASLYFAWNISKSLGVNESTNYSVRVIAEKAGVNVSNSTSGQFWIGNCNVTDGSSWSISNSIVVCKNRTVAPGLGANQPISITNSKVAFVKTKINDSTNDTIGGYMTISPSSEVFFINVSYPLTRLTFTGGSTRLHLMNTNISDFTFQPSAYDTIYVENLTNNGALNGILIHNSNGSGFVNFTNSKINGTFTNSQAGANVTIKNSNLTNGDCFIGTNRTCSFDNMKVMQVAGFVFSGFLYFYSGDSNNNVSLYNLSDSSTLMNGVLASDSQGRSIANLTDSSAVGIVVFSSKINSTVRIFDSNINFAQTTAYNSSIIFQNVYLTGRYNDLAANSLVYLNFTNGSLQSRWSLKDNTTFIASNSSINYFAFMEGHSYIYGNFSIIEKTRYSIDYYIWTEDAVATRYFPIQVLNKSSGPEVGVNVSIYNSTWSLVGSAITDANGFVDLPVNFTNKTWQPGNFKIIVRGSVGVGNISFAADTPIVIQTGDEVNLTYPMGGEFFMNYNESGLDTGEIINITWNNVSADKYYVEVTSNGSNWRVINSTNRTYFAWNISKSLGVNESTNYSVRVIAEKSGVNVSNSTSGQFWIGNCNVSGVQGGDSIKWEDSDIIVCKDRTISLTSPNDTKIIRLQNSTALVNVTMFNVSELNYSGSGIIVKNSNISASEVIAKNISASDSYIYSFYYPSVNGVTYDGFNSSNYQYRVFNDGYLNISNVSCLDFDLNTAVDKLYINLIVQGNVNITNSWLYSMVSFGNIQSVFINNTYAKRYWLWARGINNIIWLENFKGGIANTNYGNIAHSTSGFNLTVNNLSIDYLNLAEDSGNVTFNIINSSVRTLSTGSNSINNIYNSSIYSTHFGSSINYLNNITFMGGGSGVGGNAILNISNSNLILFSGHGVESTANATIYGNFNVTNKGAYIDWSASGNVTRFFPVHVLNRTLGDHSGANVSVYNSTGSLVWNGTTDVDGWAYPNVTFTNFTYNNTHNITVRGSVGYGNLSFFSDTPIIITSGCADLDGDGFNQSEAGCGVADCDDTNSSILPPYDNMYINNDTQLCPGTYQINDTGNSGVIIINKTLVKLNCAGAIITGNKSGYGVFLNSKNNFTMSNCIFANFSTGAYFNMSSYSRFINNSLSENNYGFYFQQPSYANIVNNTAYNNTYGVYTKFAMYTNITNNLIFNNSFSGLTAEDLSTETYISNNNVFNNVYGIHLLSQNLFVVNNSVRQSLKGIRLQNANNNFLIDNNATNNAEEGIYATNSGNNTFISNYAANNSNGFYIFGSAGGNSNNFFNNSAINNSLNGVYLEFTKNTSIGGLISGRNGRYGLVVNNSNNTQVIDSYFHNNSAGELLMFANNSNMPVYANNITLDDGDFENFTSIIINDSVEPFTAYVVRWAINSSGLPVSKISFRQKFVNITNITGSVSIDSISFTWNQSEVLGYNESKLGLWRYNGTWSLLNGTPDVSNNVLSFSNLNPASTYGILEDNSSVNLSLNITFPQDDAEYNVSDNFTLSVNISNSGNSNATNCNATIKITNESVLNITPTESKVHSLGNVAPGSMNEFWNLTALSTGKVNITVNVSCDSNNFSNDSVYNITILSSVNLPPVVNLSEPLNNTQFNNTNSVTVNFTVTDDLNTTLNCSLYINGVLNQTNATTLNDTLTDFVVPVGLGTYNWSVHCTDGYLSNVSEIWYFTVNDTLPPVISNIIVSVTNETATVNWTTNESANSTISYGLTSSLGGAVSNVSFFINHSILITGLDNNTLYYYNITSCDVYGNCNTTGPFNFTTLQNNVTNVSDLPPSVTSVGCVPNPTDIGGDVICRANVVDDVGIGNVTANVTKPNSVRIVQNVSCSGTNTSKNCSFTFTNTDRTGTYNVLWLANDTSGSLDTASSSFVISAPSIPATGEPSNGRPVDAPPYISRNVTVNVTPQKVEVVVPVEPKKEVVVTPVEEAPAEVPTLEFKFPYWWLIILILIFFIFLLLFFIKRKKEKKKKVIPASLAVHKHLSDYIRDARAKGFSDKTIIETLEKAGWDRENIDKAFKSI